MKRRLLIMFLSLCLLPFMVQAQHGTFRFAQITDIHFSPNNSNPTEDLLRSVAQINATDSIDFVLVTGDIAEEGDQYYRFVFPELFHLFRHPADILRNYMSVSHAHQRAGVETEEQDTFVLKFETFATKNFFESSATGIAPFRFVIAEDDVISGFQ